ncbi:RxLR effector protein [Phytophthora megakarya]|uniref:RxLR effector protein n=1 Tax=Phytophthora megakarya TaxID=4795 RepID=A0A225W8J2_9STRA|nr:RxLR effector protein [Phytophthora megakarya]
MRFNCLHALLLVSFAVNLFNFASSEKEVVTQSFDDMGRGPNWISMMLRKGEKEANAPTFKAQIMKQVSKFKEPNKVNPTMIRTQTTSDKRWESTITKLAEGTKLKKLDTSSNKQWKTTFEKFKASGQLKNVDETQAAKITEGVARQVVKTPSKWRYIKKLAEITLGAVLTALIVVGLQSMIK